MYCKNNNHNQSITTDVAILNVSSKGNIETNSEIRSTTNHIHVSGKCSLLFSTIATLLLNKYPITDEIFD